MKKPAPYTARNLPNFINRANIKLDLHRPHYRLESQHLKYLDETSAYLKKLKASLQITNINPWGVVDSIISSIHNLIVHKGATNSEISTHIKNKVPGSHDHDSIEAGGNLENVLVIPQP